MLAACEVSGCRCGGRTRPGAPLPADSNAACFAYSQAAVALDYRHGGCPLSAAGRSKRVGCSVAPSVAVVPTAPSSANQCTMAAGAGRGLSLRSPANDNIIDPPGRAVPRGAGRRKSGSHASAVLRRPGQALAWRRATPGGRVCWHAGGPEASPWASPCERGDRRGDRTPPGPGHRARGPRTDCANMASTFIIFSNFRISRPNGALRATPLSAAFCAFSLLKFPARLPTKAGLSLFRCSAAGRSHAGAIGLPAGVAALPPRRLRFPIPYTGAASSGPPPRRPEGLTFAMEAMPLLLLLRPAPSPPRREQGKQGRLRGGRSAWQVGSR